MIKIEIAGICVGLELNDAEIAQQILGRYTDFLSPNGTPEVTIQVEVRKGVQFVPLEPGLYVINLSFQDSKLTFESYFEAGSVDMTSGHGKLLMAPRSNVENFLRVLYAWHCVHHDALLLHASGVIKDGRAFVFFGPSRSGKTTVARLSLDHTVLSDDLVIISKRDGTYKAYGVPFRGDMPETPYTNAQADLCGLFRLKKDMSHFTKPLGHSQAVAGLISCVPFVTKDIAMSHRAMAICADLVTRVPVKELHFRRDQGFWRVIDESG
ncbi:MAG TPA: hypothetical protein EYP49_16845 [Anaerolineae bacterium]|nr:hypothetical protein [Anaerolineae bacterium]